jgi:hypothetical protein
MTKSSHKLINEKCYVQFNEAERSDINGGDLTDRNNDPSFYTTKVRNIKKAWKELTEKFTEETTMWQAMQVLNNFNLQCHSYCAVD